MKEDGETLVVYTPDRDEWTVPNNITFFITDQYKNFRMCWLTDQINQERLLRIFTDAWRSRAGKKFFQQEANRV